MCDSTFQQHGYPWHCRNGATSGAAWLCQAESGFRWRQPGHGGEPPPHSWCERTVSSALLYCARSGLPRPMLPAHNHGEGEWALGPALCLRAGRNGCFFGQAQVEEEMHVTITYLHSPSWRPKELAVPPPLMARMLFTIGSWHHSRLIVTRELRDHRQNGKGRSSLQIHFIF